MAYPPPAGGQPPSFKTNVNRAKTKKWVEAKSYSYEGDDWGDLDEYDEYGGYDEPPPPPKPTGLRQRGQSASADQPGVYPPQQGGYSNPETNQHGYGNIGRQGPIQQQYGARSATNPTYQAQLARSGSFDQGDERRAFSATFPHQGQPTSQSGTYHPDPYAQAPNLPPPPRDQFQQGPPTPQSALNINDLNLHRDQVHPPPVDNRPVPAPDQARPPSTSGRTASMTSNLSVDFHNRRDFSPSAVPPPLHTRGSPSPHNKPDPQSAIRPPRKSSLIQANQSQQPYGDQDAGKSYGQDLEAEDPTTRERTDSNTGKPLPFVRPADIYKRMKEEKERERQSQESSRPSMEAVMDDGRNGDEPKGDSSGRSEHSQDGEPRQRSRSTLDSVAERKSEYGMPNIPQGDLGAEGKTTEQRATATEPVKAVESNRINDSLSPQLPDVARMSSFGELFGGTSHPLEESSLRSAPKPTDPSQMPPHQLAEDQTDSTLQHQPSLGFRSVVHQAFDTTTEPIPETPLSSNADSSIGRSGSGGTSVVSPIISRGPSSATQNLKLRDPQIRPATPPTENESLNNEGRPGSSGSFGTPKVNPRKRSPEATNQRPTSFIPGHRRDLSTPSPDNSPARTPAVEANKQLQQPQEAEIGMPTPIETRFPYDYARSEGSPVKLSDPSDFATTHPSRTGRFSNEAETTLQAMSGETPKSPAESTRSRVRNLADKFESGRSSPAGSERASSPVKSSFLPTQASTQSRPLAADRLDSFRPRLPGGWESSASLAPLANANKPEATSAPISLQRRLQNTETDGPSPRSPALGSTGSRSQDFDRDGPTSSPTKDAAPSGDPFASLAAAGSALAGAFSTATGTDKGEEANRSSTRSTVRTGEQPDQEAAREDSRMTGPRNISVSQAFTPEAIKPNMLTIPDDEASSIMPTPLDKLSQPTQPAENQALDYFAAGPIPKQQASGDSYTTQGTASTKRSQLLPSLSTDTTPQYESDRLRREIIRELSPRVTSEPNTADSEFQSRDASRQSTGLNMMRDPHESMVIPREYDSYWNGSGSEQSSRVPSVQASPNAVRDAMSQDNEGPTIMSPVPETASQPPTVGGEAQQGQNQLVERPDLQPHRFSWERPDESDPSQKESLPSNPSMSNQEVGGVPSNEAGRQMSAGDYDQQFNEAPVLKSKSVSLGEAPITVENNRFMDPETEKPSLHTDAPGSAQHETGPIDAETSLYPSEGLQKDKERSGDLSQPMGPTSDIATLPALPTAQPKIQSFREILALKEAADRIKAYNETREQFANINSGLEHWLAVTMEDLPEHSDILPNGRLLGSATHKPAASRGKLGGLLPGNTPAQQPYYQQYLNASSPTSGSNMSQVPSGSSPQGYSPLSGGGKLSSQQMQARGKDLLHSAGVIGGKANVAAKGLFSKGKSKFRSGNADKAPNSPFNTKHGQGTQQQHESSKSSPSTPRSEAFTEQSYSPKHPVSSRPLTLVAPSEQQPEGAAFSGEQDQSQPTTRAVVQSKDGDTHTTLPNDLSQANNIEISPRSDEAASRDTVQIESATGTYNPSDTPGNPRLTSNQTDRGQQQHDQPKGVQSPHTPSSSNHTPTQADYVDYFRRGSSPTAKIPQETAFSNRQHLPGEEESSQQPPSQMQQSGPGSPPTLKSKYSTGASREVPASVTRSTGADQEQSWPDQSMVQRPSEDSDGTFQTAESGIRLDSGSSATYPYQSTSGAPQNQPADGPAEERPREMLPLSATSVAVPAANMRDQTTARPFSFVQFSQSPAPRPFEDYSRRQPSIDSTSSKIDPNQDVPPSPMSSRQSMSQIPISQPDSFHPIGSRAGRGLPSSTGQGSSGPGSGSFSQPYRDSSFQHHSAFRPEHSPNNREEGPAQHHPAPTSPQDPVIPRQEATKDSVEGIGPPLVPRPRNSTSTSKRGSRSSAFFRSFRTPSTETSSPQLPGENDEHGETGQQETNKLRKTKSKRDSLFRSLTGGKVKSNGEGSGYPKDVAPTASVQDNAEPVTDTVEKNSAPTKGPSKYRNRLSRAATAKMEEQQRQEPNKKNRFSAIGSLFGRNKDRSRGSTAGIDQSRQSSQQSRPQASERPHDRNSHAPSSTQTGHGDGPSQESDDPYHYTRDKLARQGFLAQESKQRPSKPSEPSAYTQDSAQRQQPFPPRHQSLGHGAARSEQRPSDWSREPSTNNTNARPQQVPVSSQQNAAPPQHHRVLSSVTTRSTTRHSGLPHSDDSKPPQFSSTTTTITTTSRTPNPTSRHQQRPQGNSFSRSESPPPPPPPPKDTWHQSKPHQRSTSDSSFTQAVRNSNDFPSKVYSVPKGPPPPLNSPQTPDPTSPPLQHKYSTPPASKVFNVPKSPPATSFVAGLQPQQSANPTTIAHPPNNHTHTASTESRQSLPSIQTNVPDPSLPSMSRDPCSLEARNRGQSQIESAGMPRVEQPNAGTTTNTTTLTTTSAGRSGTECGNAVKEGDGIRQRGENDDEPIVMSATSFPGQEWQPSYGWEGD
ncbi:MAG: hypothetical protein LQ338_005652 [Usnochroma carphineum]|nr:MAG: hypothetical protein LQ338_005652 [Usnochroma carphineum]